MKKDDLGIVAEDPDSDDEEYRTGVVFTRDENQLLQSLWVLFAKIRKIVSKFHSSTVMNDSLIARQQGYAIWQSLYNCVVK